LLEESYVTVPGTAVAPVVVASVKVPAAVIVEAVIGVLKVAATFWLSGTLVAPLEGTVEVTAGVGAVAKVHTTLAARGAPVGSFAPVVTVAVYSVEPASRAVGVNVAVFPA